MIRKIIIFSMLILILVGIIFLIAFIGNFFSPSPDNLIFQNVALGFLILIAGCILLGIIGAIFYGLWQLVKEINSWIDIKICDFIYWWNGKQIK